MSVCVFEREIETEKEAAKEIDRERVRERDSQWCLVLGVSLSLVCLFLSLSLSFLGIRQSAERVCLSWDLKV